MKKILVFCIVICLVSVSPLSILAQSNATDYSEYDLIEYDYVNKTERIISADEMYDYSAVTSTTYELSNMASYLENNASEEASTF